MFDWLVSGSKAKRQKNEEALRQVYSIQLKILDERYNIGSTGDQRAKTILSSQTCPEWMELYEAEQRLIQVVPEAQIAAEATRRLMESKALGVPTATELEKKFSEANDPNIKRAVFWTIIDDLQWKYVKRSLDRSSRRRAAELFYITGTGVLIPIFGLLVAFLLTDPMNWIPHIHVIVSLYFGMLGAFLSRIIAFQSSLDTIDFDQIDRDFSGWSITIRLLIGIMGALVMYLLIRSGLIGGSIFPSKNFDEKLWQPVEPTKSQYALPGIDFAKLIVWSIVAGFSERLIPDQLARLETAARETQTGNRNTVVTPAPSAAEHS